MSNGVEEGQAGDDRATGAVDVQVDGLGAVFGIEVLQSGESNTGEKKYTEKFSKQGKGEGLLRCGKSSAKV